MKVYHIEHGCLRKHIIQATRPEIGLSLASKICAMANKDTSDVPSPGMLHYGIILVSTCYHRSTSLMVKALHQVRCAKDGCMFETRLGRRNHN